MSTYSLRQTQHQHSKNNRISLTKSIMEEITILRNGLPPTAHVTSRGKAFLPPLSLSVDILRNSCR